MTFQFNLEICRGADYWKSQAKKFCDFCKCWIADNKPSVQFHESGKKHKENVAKRLGEISKNSAKSYRESLQLDQDMKKMEEEALKAYMKDLQENPDYTSKRIVEESEKKRKELEDKIKQDVELKSVEPEEAPVTQPEASQSKVWYEAKSDEGHTYYWHITTGESKWDIPEEGFFSIEEQENQQQQAKLKQELKRKKKEEKSRKTKLLEKEGLKKKKRKESDEISSTMVGPEPKPEPLGPWIVVEPKVEEEIDLELPKQDYVAVNVPTLTEPEIKFKEKTVKNLETDVNKYHGFVKRETEESPETFKKRKFNKGNMRQKLNRD